MNGVVQEANREGRSKPGSGKEAGWLQCREAEWASLGSSPSGAAALRSTPGWGQRRSKEEAWTSVRRQPPGPGREDEVETVGRQQICTSPEPEPMGSAGRVHVGGKSGMTERQRWGRLRGRQPGGPGRGKGEARVLGGSRETQDTPPCLQGAPWTARHDRWFQVPFGRKVSAAGPNVTALGLLTQDAEPVTARAGRAARPSGGQGAAARQGEVADQDQEAPREGGEPDPR